MIGNGDILREIARKLIPLYDANKTTGGHDKSHVIRMLNIADYVVNKDKVDPVLLKVAIWLHNLDRAGFDEKEIPKFIRETLYSVGGFSEKEISLVLDAVEKHSLLNDETDSPLLRDLKDVDRLDSGLMAVLRSAAYRWDAPLYLPGDFNGKPPVRGDEKFVVKSVVQDLNRVLEWEEMIRSPKAKKFGKKRFAHLRKFLKCLNEELKEIENV